MTKFRFALERSKKKEVCPNCSKRTYVRFVDYQNNHIPFKYGRCDREDRCGYFLSPYSDGYAQENIDPNYKPEFTINAQERPISYISRNVVMPTLQIDIQNKLYLFLCSKFDRELVSNAFVSYRVGFDRDWCIFWQHDILGLCRSGKFMNYLKTGRRNKDTVTTWEHSRKSLGQSVYPDFNLKQCFFGEHLLANDTRKPVAIVESEKTALIASFNIPAYIWIACGSKNGLSDYKCEVLKGRSVTLFPDLGAYSYWYEKAVKYGFRINNDIDQYATEDDRLNGFDLADFLLR